MYLPVRSPVNNFPGRRRMILIMRKISWIRGGTIFRSVQSSWLGVWKGAESASIYVVVFPMKKPLGRNNDLTFHMNPELCSFYSFIDVCIYWMQIDDQRSEMGSPKWRKKHISEHRKGVCPGVSVSVPASPARKARC